MKKIIGSLIFAMALSPAARLWSAELTGTVAKVDRAKNLIVVRTDKGQETLELVKDTKGVEHAKEGSKVMVKFSEKDGVAKVSGIAPAQ
ncbi:MAG: hypothetical protein FJ145_22155 [Deltaproteobacteria bacterium]|nr:hypothetical protein [Deltaproteobacteria bacterium]